jgi:hypothetical protein
VVRPGIHSETALTTAAGVAVGTSATWCSALVDHSATIESGV